MFVETIPIDMAIARTPSPSSPPDEWSRIISDRQDMRYGMPTWEAMRTAHLGLCYMKECGATHNTTDLGAAKQALICRVVALQVWCERTDHALMKHGGLPDDYAKNSSLLLRLLKDLGITQKQKGKTGLSKFLADQAANDAKKPEPKFDANGIQQWLAV